MARVNSVAHDAPARSALFAPRGSGTEVEVERCAPTDSTPIDPPDTGIANGEMFDRSNWTGVLDDGTEVDSRPGYWLEIAVIAGGCSRGWISFDAPGHADLVEVVLTRWIGTSPPPEVRRWDVTRSRAVEAPLRPTTPPDAVAVGEPMKLPVSRDSTATVLSVTDDVPPSPDSVDYPVRAPDTALGEGRKLAEIEAEVCVNRGLLAVSELQFLIATTDNYIGNAGGEALNGLDPSHAPRGNSPGLVGSLRVGGEFRAVDLYTGECFTGTVQIDLPQESDPAFVIVTDSLYQEVGRIYLDE